MRKFSLKEEKKKNIGKRCKKYYRELLKAIGNYLFYKEIRMSAGQLANVSPANDGDQDSERDITKRIQSRQTKEIIVGVCGAVGCNLSDVIREVSSQFENFGYAVRYIKISDIIKEYFSKKPLPKKHETKNIYQLEGAERYDVLQDLGNEIRESVNPKALAIQAIKKISIERELQKQVNNEEDPPRTVYIVDQLKNPAEADLFKQVYKSIFYLVGVLSPQQTRLRNLQQEGISPTSALALVERDRNENSKYGQKLEKTIQRSDYFIRYNLDSVANLTKPCSRFVGLVHGKNGLTPTKDESGMYAAFSASLKSACLSRQVGAAISDKNGNVLSLGWNDVPKAHGGLYSSDDEVNDQRCIHHGRKCYNDDYKGRLVKNIIDIIGREVSISEANASHIAELIQEETRAGSIIEYSRAIHAEMEAILALARKQNASSENCTLYTTTYPCHNCARHIIAAGISRVVFIEPYEKSLAMELHSDAISSEQIVDGKVIFESFDGVSPRQYSSFFSDKGKRKDENGQAIDIVNRTASQISVELLESYIDVEAKVVEQAVEQFS